MHLNPLHTSKRFCFIFVVLSNGGKFCAFMQLATFLLQLRRSFTNVEEETFDASGSIGDENDDNGLDDFPDFEHTEFDPPNNAFDMQVELSPNHRKVCIVVITLYDLVIINLFHNMILCFFN